MGWKLSNREWEVADLVISQKEGELLNLERTSGNIGPESESAVVFTPNLAFELENRH